MEATLPSSHDSKKWNGSASRCLAATTGTAQEVAKRLSALIAPFGFVSPDDHWMPQGLAFPAEHRLGRRGFPYSDGKGDEDEMLSWWLTDYRGTTQTPNADIFSTCILNGVPGVLFAEAKAHSYELKNEEGGKRFSAQSSRANHERIAKAIQQANDDLNRLNPGYRISRDCRYQMSNRFAWAWRIASRGTPVALVYLGFSDAHEMLNRGNTQTGIFRSEADWTSCLLSHSLTVVPNLAWGLAVNTSGAPIFPLIRCMKIDPLDAALADSRIC